MSSTAVQSPSSALSTTSLVIGVVSIFMSWTFFAPVAGLVVGIMARGREPHARTTASWGIGLNAVMIAVGVVLWMVWGGIILGTLGIGVATSMA